MYITTILQSIVKRQHRHKANNIYNNTAIFHNELLLYKVHIHLPVSVTGQCQKQTIG